MSKDWLQDVRKFDWKGLHGKVLRITVGESEEDGIKYTCVMGIDEQTGDYYVLHTESKLLTTNLTRRLSEKTGESMMECKKALFASGGNFEKAIEYLNRPNKIRSYV